MALAEGWRPPLWAILVGLIIVQVGFGGYGIVLQKFAKNAGADSLVFSMLRDAFCAPVLYIAAAAMEGGLHLPRLIELPFFFLLGLLGMFGNQYFYIQGLYFSTPDIASIFQPLIPVFTAFFAFLTCMEKLPAKGRAYQWLKILGILLGAGGAILMTVEKSSAPVDSVKQHMYTDGNCTTPSNSTVFGTSACNDMSLLLPTRAGSGSYFMAKCSSNSSVALVSFCTDKDCSSQNCTDFERFATTGACRFGFNGTHSAEYSCMNSADAKNKLLGIIFLLINCSCMAVYVLLQKRFIFNKSKEHKMDPHDLGRWTSFPISVTAHSYFFGAICMAVTAAVRYAINGDKSVFVIPQATYAGLAYAVFVSSALCYGLITYCNKFVSAIVVTSFWPLQVFVTVILAYFVFNDELKSLEYVGMLFIILGMLTVSYGNYKEQKQAPTEDEKRRLLLND